MTNEEAKRRLEVWLKCMDCPEDKQCYDSHLHSTCEYTDYCDETPVSEAVKVAIKALEQTTWIPVSERLPEKNVEVLATTEWGAVTIAEMYSANDWFIHEGTTNAETDEIKAWMPLPQAYREVEE